MKQLDALFPAAPPLSRPSPRRSFFVTIGLVGIMVGCLVLLVLPLVPKLAWHKHQLSTHNSVGIKGQNQPLNSAAVAEAKHEGDWLVIPSIDVETPIVQGKEVGILDQKEGVWNQTGSPGQGNFVLAGHRFKYLPPNTSTFYNLDKLNVGDEIIVWWQGQQRNYITKEKFTVKRDQVDILNPTDNEQLTLYTCQDLDTTKRLVVVATPKE